MDTVFPQSPPIFPPNPSPVPPIVQARVKALPVHLGGGFFVPAWLASTGRSSVRFAIPFFAVVAGLAAYHLFISPKSITSSSSQTITSTTSIPASESPTQLPETPPRIPLTPTVQPPRLLYFYFQSCQACATIRPAVDAAETSGIPITRVDYYGENGPGYWAKYGVTAAPTFVLVTMDGTVLGRAVGINPLKGGLGDKRQIQKFYNDPNFRKGLLKLGSTDELVPPTPTTPLLASTLQSTVRIRVNDGKMIGMGSGTIVDSNLDESVIVSCAHIFKVRGAPMGIGTFPNPVTVDLFDGSVRQSPTGVGVARFARESYRAQVVSHNFQSDVSVLRITPGKLLPYSPVVPTGYTPSTGQLLVAEGCSEGQAATAWDTKVIASSATVDGVLKLACTTAPKQGRSGGGLHVTETNELVGVCDFAEPRGNVGLYATPESIHQELRRARYGHLVRTS